MRPALSTLFHEVERLDNRSLDSFINNVITLKVRRNLPNKHKIEANLLSKINKSLTLKELEQFQLLNQKRLSEKLSDKEYAELVILVEKIENLNVSRLKHLSSLAQIRKISVRELMQQIGLNG
jgi:hypothetical protein